LKKYTIFHSVIYFSLFFPSHAESQLSCMLSNWTQCTVQLENIEMKSRSLWCCCCTIVQGRSYRSVFISWYIHSLIAQLKEENDWMMETSSTVVDRYLWVATLMVQWKSARLKNSQNIIQQMQSVMHHLYIQGVPGGKDLTSGECSLGQTITI